jgi:hypothetical protein
MCSAFRIVEQALDLQDYIKRNKLSQGNVKITGETVLTQIDEAS